MSKRQLSGPEILQDIRSGMNDAALMEKSKLSAQGLLSVFTKLVTAGVLKQAELDSRVPSHERTINVVWKCPACGKTQPREFEECPYCGIVAARFVKRQEVKDNREVEKQLQQKKETSTDNKNEKADTERPVLCHKCGQSLHSEGWFCAHCGASIRVKKDRADEIQGPVSNVSRLTFLKGHILVISGTVVAIFILGIIAFGFKVRSDVRKEDLIGIRPVCC